MQLTLFLQNFILLLKIINIRLGSGVLASHLRNVFRCLFENLRSRSLQREKDAMCFDVLSSDTCLACNSSGRVAEHTSGRLYLFAVERWNSVPKATEAVFDVVAPFSFQRIVVSPFVVV